MMRRAPRSIATLVAILSLLVTEAPTTPAAAQDSGGKDLGSKDLGGKDLGGKVSGGKNTEGNDLRDIRLGMPATDLPDAGYVNLACATDPQKTLTAWTGWRDCATDSSGFHAIKFGYDPALSREGTIVAGHPAILTLLVDDAGTVSGLRIETDPKARLYIRKKAFLFGLQAKSRYGSDGWSCTDAQPDAGEQPVGGVFVRERCTKTIPNRSIVVERNLFRKPEQDIKSFVDETRMTILLTKG
jgi:hypothetical protein